MATALGELLGPSSLVFRALSPSTKRWLIRPSLGYGHMSLQLVWFKRDLRVTDHAPLEAAAARGPVIALYIVEPSLLGSPDHDTSHYEFVRQTLVSLNQALMDLGGGLVVRVGEATDVLQGLFASHRFVTIWSHEETGNALSYERDKRVARWCRAHGVAWHQAPSNGVWRALQDRDGWSRRWSQRMTQPEVKAPDRLSCPMAPEPPPSYASLGLRASERVGAQVGGLDEADQTLMSFLSERGVAYRSDMSSPLTGADGCSRLSPYLAWGSLSVRQVHQATARRQRWVRLARQSGRSVDPRWSTSLQSFQSRLRWRCHFIQRLESEPELEHVNMHRGYDGLREPFHDERSFARLQAGQTGFPMVDACVRSLRATGWLNFRMRAMLVSFACWDLWLHWRPVALWLAPLFLDYEPGIHFSQCQMQAGTAGINTTRIYSPVKQAHDQDPTGAFIRRWVPEIAALPTQTLAAPWLAPPLELKLADVRLDHHYPRPMVDHADAVKRARAAYGARRREPAVRDEAKDVLRRHGSRRRGTARRRAGSAPR